MMKQEHTVRLKYNKYYGNKEDILKKKKKKAPRL